MFNTLEKAVNWVESVKRFGDKLDLSRMVIACEMLGHPERDLTVVHVAGTNGKGSTVSYLKHMLIENGYNVGTYTSPYIVRFNERITYNNDDISNNELLQYINQVHDLHELYLKMHNDVITFFECITLISFLFFKDKKCDYVIYEVGLGGLLDATNVVIPLITAITSISYDHMGVLGNTLEEIAINKLGIVKNNAPLVTSVNDPKLLELFKSYTNKVQSKMIVVDSLDVKNLEYGTISKFSYRNKPYQISMLGTHQVNNACLAIEILHQLTINNGLKLNDTKTTNGLLKAKWPGRLERFGNIILDGAHNIGGINAIKDSFETLFKDKYIKVLFASMADKEYTENIRVLETVCDEITFTQFDYPRCETALNLYNASNHNNKHMNVDSYVALDKLKDLKDNEILLITGSLYFVSHIRKVL